MEDRGMKGRLNLIFNVIECYSTGLSGGGFIDGNGKGSSYGIGSGGICNFGGVLPYGCGGGPILSAGFGEGGGYSKAGGGNGHGFGGAIIYPITMTIGV